MSTKPCKYFLNGYCIHVSRDSTYTVHAYTYNNNILHILYM